MPSYRCCVGGFDNDTRYPERIIKRGHVQELKFHHFPKDPEKRNQWVKQVSKGLVGLEASNYKTVCSNHFETGKPTFGNHVPTLYLVISDKRVSPKKRKVPRYRVDSGTAAATSSSGTKKRVEEEPTVKYFAVQCSFPVRSALNFAQLTREHDVMFYT